MLRRFCANGWGALTAAESSAVEKLVESRDQFPSEDGFVEIRSEVGYAACTVYLKDVDRAARALCLEAAPRAYRTGFSANYRALFPDNNRHYRVDVLEASLDQHSAIWVNGDKFELSHEAITHAERLQQTWKELDKVLFQWNEENAKKPTREDLARALMNLDAAWAQFECKYISELIAIEEQARQLIVRAVNFEGQLRRLREGSAEYQEAERSLVGCIAHLNSVANFKRKGRDDLGCDILESAKTVMKRCKTGQQSPFDAARQEAAEILASDVVAAYNAMRSYLYEVGTCIERVDPHLCNNNGLVARLVDWEESWELGARYVKQVSLLDSLCDLVSEVKAAQTLAPALTAMCEDCDVELFLVLPRMVLLVFLADPTSQRAELVKTLLPHRFGSVGDGGASLKLDPELKALLDNYVEAVGLVERTRPATGASPKDAAWEVLVKRAVLGATEPHQIYGGSPEATQKLVEDFMREVERWSLELQRHCPEDWNQFSAVLVQCLTGGSPKEPAPKFQV